MVRIADSHSDYTGVKFLQGCVGRTDSPIIDVMEEGGVGLQVFAVWVPAESPDKLNEGLNQVSCLHAAIDGSEGRMMLCTSRHDVKAPGIKAVLAIESGDAIDCRIDMIEHYFTLGARMMSLAWNNGNEFAAGCLSEGGLKEKGVRAVKELNRLRMAFDVSHISDLGFWEALDIYAYAPCASHSCCFSIRPNPRNLKTPQIKEIIKRGGYIGVNFFTEFLKGPLATVDNILFHIEYILSLGGEKCAGLGSDFCGMTCAPEGINSAADFQKIPEAMAKRNYSDALIEQICYSNFERYILKFL